MLANNPFPGMVNVADFGQKEIVKSDAECLPRLAKPSGFGYPPPIGPAGLMRP